MHNKAGQDDADLLDVAGVPVSPQLTYVFEELLGLHGRQFVENAYRLLLAREPEDDGRSYYMARLLEGTSKIQILSDMAKSKEALELAVNPPGLARAMLLLRLSQLPVIGRIVGKIVGVEGRSFFDVRLRSLEESLHADRAGRVSTQDDAAAPAPDLRALIAGSGLFDAQWYRQHSPELGTDIDLIEHFLTTGAIEGRSPSKNFDSDFYRARYFDVRRSGMNPLVHFLQQGAAEGRRSVTVAQAAELRERTRKSSVNHVIQCLKAPVVTGEVAVLVTHGADAAIKPYVAHYLAALNRVGIAVVLVIAAGDPARVIPPDAMSLVGGLFVSESPGDGVAARAHVLQLQPDLLSAPILYLLNDSVFGPLSDEKFAQLIGRIRESPADMISLRDDNDLAYVPAFFLAIKRRALSTVEFHRFIDLSGISGGSARTARASEDELSAHLQALGLTTEAISSSAVAASHHAPGESLLNWKRLIDGGVPFLGRTALAGADFNEDHTGWRQFLASEGYDLRLIDSEMANVVTRGTARTGLSSKPDARFVAATGVGPRPRLRVAFIGPWNYDDGLGLASRGYISALWHAYLSLNVHPIRRPFHLHRQLAPTIDCRSFSGDADVVIVHLNPDEWPALLTDEHWEIISRARKVVGAWVCEAEKTPASWSPAINSVDAIWAPSRYAADVFERSTRVPVAVVPYCVAIRPEIAPPVQSRAILRQFGIAMDQRFILCCVDGGNFLERRNPVGLIRAYEASGLAKEGWLLVLRNVDRSESTAENQQLQEVIHGTPGVILIEEPLDHVAVNALMNMTDIYASAHRTDIAGLTIAEAMACGKPVVATDFGGSRDFLDFTCGYPVPYLLRTKEGRTLAEVDIVAMADSLRKAAASVAAGDLSVGRAARARISQHASPSEVVRSMRQSAVAALGLL